MMKTLFCALLILAVSPLASAKRLSNEEMLVYITSRGRALADYDRAVWEATNVLRLENPVKASQLRIIAKKNHGAWEVVFGSMSGSEFLIEYKAVERSRGTYKLRLGLR